MNKYVLTAENIKMRYGANAVLNDVSTHVEHSGIYGLVGKNGSEKTTLHPYLFVKSHSFIGYICRRFLAI